ncbi:MAG: hypothetical protein EOO70_05170 [Myxococcaceae bacterium]|nr:MAG: hypothetical protein EOO70_05170 [Myxococcaceae bacterium]
MDTQKTVIWKVHCPQDGPQLLKHTGLHVYVRQGLPQHVVTYFCPECGQQRWQLVNKKVVQSLIDDLAVHWTLMRVPLEALEPHYGPVVTEADVDTLTQEMNAPDWPRL